MISRAQGIFFVVGIALLLLVGGLPVVRADTVDAGQSHIIVRVINPDNSNGSSQNPSSQQAEPLPSGKVIRSEFKTNSWGDAKMVIRHLQQNGVLPQTGFSYQFWLMILGVLLVWGSTIYLLKTLVKKRGNL